MDLQKLKRILVAAISTFLLFRFWKFIARLQAVSRRLIALPGPGQETEHWFFGHVLGPLFLKPGAKFTSTYITENMLEILTNITKDYRGRGFMRVLAINRKIGTPLGFIVPTDIGVVREILSMKNTDTFSKGRMYDVSHSLIGHSVLRESGAKWAAQRPAVERGFSHDIVSRAVPKATKTVNELIVKWERDCNASQNQTVQDVRVDALKLTMDVIGRAAFGYDFNSTTSEVAPLYEPFNTILVTLEHRGQYILEHFTSFLPTERNLKFDKAMEKLNNCVDEIVGNREAQRKANGGKSTENDFLDELLDSPLAGTQTLKDNIKTLLFAGHDTTGAALAWFFHLLAKHPEMQTKVRAEILSKLGKDKDPTYEQLEEFELMNACFLETLRLYPSAGFTRRVTGTDSLALGGHDVPELVEILVLPWLLHRDERYWDEPLKYAPERFLNEGYEHVHQGGEPQNARSNSLQTRIGRISRENAYLPFSMAHRGCVGRSLSLMEMRVVAVKLLQKFSFKSCPDEEFAAYPVLTLTLNPKSIKLIPVLEVC